MGVTLKVDPEKLREESPIYKNLNLLVSYNYEYCKALNRSDVTYELAVENLHLVQKRENCKHWQRRKFIVMFICVSRHALRDLLHISRDTLLAVF